jgi:hypothetical protein
MLQIKGDVEEGVRIAPLLYPLGAVVEQGINPCGGYIRVVLQIERSVEERVRITLLRGPGDEVMNRWSYPLATEFWAVSEVIGVVEEIGGAE